MKLSLRAQIIAVVVGAAGFLATFSPVTVAMAVDLQSKHRFQIPAQDLSTALLAFSDQAKVQVLMGGGAKPDAKSEGARGEFSAIDALNAILANTGFTYKQIDKETVAIVKADAAKPVSQAPKTENAAADLRVSQGDAPPSMTTDNPNSQKNKSGEATSPEDGSNAKLADVVVTGTRFNGRLATDSPVPVDIVSGSELKTGGYTELPQMLEAAIPSFNLPRPSTSAGIDLIRAASLRGLAPDETLVLVNGKRWHASSVVNTNNTFGRGSVAVDFNTIPAGSIDHIEVLRDGAAAQYGSDAIAGVVNIILDKSLGYGVDATIGETAKGDGLVKEASAYAGVPFADNGVLRLNFFYRDHGSTSRTTPDTRQQYFGSNGTTAPSANFGSGIGLTPSNGTLDPREATFNRNDFQYGDPSYVSAGAFFNGELPLQNGMTLYSFGGFTRTTGVSPDFFRVSGNDATIRAIFPDGFRPHDDETLTDVSIAGGLKGVTAGDWGWDISTEYGSNKYGDIVANDDNASLGAASPTSFNIGGLFYGQLSTNLDITKQVSLGLANPLQVAFGFEHRLERYQITAGDTGSYINGGIPILDGPHAGKPAPAGAQATPGFAPSDAVDVSRHSDAGYLDLEDQVTDRLLLTGAARYENFSDFGQDSTYKASARLKIAKPLALRASVSTGFHAPALQQSWISSSTTLLVNGSLLDARLYPVSNPAAKLLGATPLKPEKSDNDSVGITFDEGPISASLDFYRIAIKDRILLSSIFQDPRITQYLSNNGYSGVAAASYFTNGADTTTQGIDLASRYRLGLNELGKLTVTLAANATDTTFNRIAPTPQALANLGITAPLIDYSQQVRLVSSSPKDKEILGLDWDWKKISVSLRNIRYGEYEFVAFTGLKPAQIAALTPGYKVRLVPTAPGSANSQVVQIFGAKIITDLDFTYRFTPKVSASAGVDNLFGVYPTKNIASTVAGVAVGSNGSDNAGTLPYNTLSPFGFDGAFAYVKFQYSF